MSLEDKYLLEYFIYITQLNTDKLSFGVLSYKRNLLRRLDKSFVGGHHVPQIVTYRLAHELRYKLYNFHCNCCK